MIGIFVTFLVALVGLLLLFSFSFRVDKTEERSENARYGYPSVEGVSEAFSFDLASLCGKDDYRQLGTRPELESVRRKFWRDRRRIMVMWLGDLERDVRVLWEFRRFLVRNGLQATLKEEVAVACAALVALLYVKMLRVTIFLLGPFAVPRAVQNARSLVQVLSRRDGALLSRVPIPRKAEIERKWAQHLIVLRAG
jgi:hypothetical protein